MLRCLAMSCLKGLLYHYMEEVTGAPLKQVNQRDSICWVYMAKSDYGRRIP